MELCFGKISRKVAVQHDVDELWSTITHEIPGLTAHKDNLQMRYIDDEGDDILVTTTDELQEAIRVGKETSNGILLLNLSVTGMGARDRAAIENAADHDDDSTDEEIPVSNPITSTTVTPTKPDIFKTLKDAGTLAISEINTALATASSEIETLLSQLGTACANKKKAEQELTAMKVELEKENSKFLASEQQVMLLTKELATTKQAVADAKTQKERDLVRLQTLESQVAEGTEWENKWKIAESQRLKLDQQLKTLRSALKDLTETSLVTTTTATPTVTAEAVTPETPETPEKTTPIPVTAEVVSSEIVPPSPVVESSPAPELPPPYENHVPITQPEPTSFPSHCPAPSPLELKRQQQLHHLKEMGFHLTLEQLNEKLVEHNDNMEHVVHSLL